MVQSKLSGFLTAILAGIMVTPENFKAGQLPSQPRRTSDYTGQANYRGHLEFAVNRTNKAGAIFQHLGLILIEQYYRPPYSTDVERLITLVQYQYRNVYHN